MKYIIYILSLIGLFAVTALGQPTITLYQNSMSSGVGGQFTAITSDNGTFQTFCDDTLHVFYPGVTYYYSVSQQEYVGGAPLTAGTAYLYRQFLSGSLPGYNYNSPTSAGQLQDVIWGLQGESDGNSLADFVTGDAFYDDVVSHFGTILNAELPNNPSDGIAVMNLYDSNGNAVQSQLTSVPEAGSMLVSACLFLPFFLRRK